MRRYTRKTLLKLADTLEEAHSLIRQETDKGNADSVISLLEQCQKCAVTIGESIEASEGEGTKAVKQLEDYCEGLYNISEEVREQRSNSIKTSKWLQKTLISIKNSITYDIPETLETVFLPYKASMWDSLESVWRKASEADDTEAYVIPIPYYDRNSDGSFGEEHYEGNDYPEDVPVTDYRKYDFETRHPDRIYIHNPYDGNNFVTSVHPFFYSKNLKKYTDELIYIPYFVLSDPDPDNEAVLEGISHFVVVPAVINADKVIVQSENMREAYVKIMTRETGEHSRQYWEEKISGEGSPKFDKVSNTRKEDLKIPEEWERLINKSDGSRRKIIFYNTSVQALLDNDVKMLDKIESALKLFRENREEVTLLWRPHPLIKATISSMRPALWERYSKIVEDYRSAGWGIYDDSPDIDRAIILSDAYYGDHSSVVELYKKTGKPIMIQNPEIINE